jgi:hypothetical protein
VCSFGHNRQAAVFRFGESYGSADLEARSGWQLLAPETIDLFQA